MSAYLDLFTANDAVDIDHFANLNNLHTNNATKIVRLIKDKVDLAQLEAGALLDHALDLLSEEIELDL